MRLENLSGDQIIGCLQTNIKRIVYLLHKNVFFE
jgi:hypothetical protein